MPNGQKRKLSHGTSVLRRMRQTTETRRLDEPERWPANEECCREEVSDPIKVEEVFAVLLQ